MSLPIFRKVIDIAFKYQYESPDAFSLAFKKYQGFNEFKLRTE